jgi:hypothetical protein
MEIKSSTLRPPTGWESLNLTPSSQSIINQHEMEAEALALARSFQDTFTKGSGPIVLSKIEQFVYSKPLLEEGPNMTELNLSRSGMREVIEFIQMQILLAQKGE